MNPPDSPSSSPSSSTRRRLLEQRFLAAARRRPVDERVPAGFARRVQLQVRAAEAANPAAAWLRGWWQALIPALGCLVIVLCLQPHRTPSAAPELASDAETTELSLWDALDDATGEADL